jgi:hypothetical protein
MLNNMMVNCKHLKAVAFTLVKLPTNKVKTYNYGYAAQLILERSASTLGRESSFFRKLFKGCNNLKSLFPQELEDDMSNHDGFILVQPKKSSKQSEASSMSLKETFNMLSAHINATVDENGKVWIVIGGRGGRRSVNIYFKYKDGIYGAHYAFHGVSGAYIKAFTDINDAWAEIERRFPGVNSFDALRKFHEGIPDTETNMSPTWSDVDGETRHQFGSVAYAFTEADDADLLLLRKQATLKVTGTENGEVNQRSHYYASLFNPNKLFTGAIEDEPFKSNDEHNQQGEQENEDGDDEYPFSQDHLPPMDMEEYQESASQQGSSNSTSNRDLSPTKKRKVDGTDEPSSSSDYFDATILNTSTDSSNFDAVPIAVSLPMASVKYDFLLYVNPFKAGIGAWWPEQTRIGKFGLFPDCKVVFFLCPKKLVTSFREFVHHNKMWGKWQLFTSLIHTEKYVTYERSSFYLEKLARDPLIQYVKASIHPSHEKELADLLRIQQHSGGQPIFDHFMKNWQKDSIDTDGKKLAGEWRVPGPDTDFIPSRWIPARRNEPINEIMFDGESESF